LATGCPKWPDPLSGWQSPQAGNASSVGVGPTRLSYASGGPIQDQFGDAGQIQTTYGPADNYSADRQRVEDSLMARMNPQLAIEENKLQQQLADQGIRYGSQAYSNAMLNYQQQANDARWGAISQAGQEQQRMQQQAGALAAFQNQAQQQQYEENLGRGTFANQAQAQATQQNAALASFYNQGLLQQQQQQMNQFNAANSARNQYMQEQFALRNQPINEITALLGGSQVSMPNFINAQTSQIPTTDMASILNNNFNQQMSVYNAQNTQYNNILGGILGLGGNVAKAAALSDRRMKENITKIGTVLAAPEGGEGKELPLYQYNYKGEPAQTHVGPMAQDVEQVDPDAVLKDRKGIRYIKPAQVMGDILRG